MTGDAAGSSSTPPAPAPPAPPLPPVQQRPISPTCTTHNARARACTWEGACTWEEACTWEGACTWEDGCTIKGGCMHMGARMVACTQSYGGGYGMHALCAVTCVSLRAPPAEGARTEVGPVRRLHQRAAASGCTRWPRGRGARGSGRARRRRVGTLQCGREAAILVPAASTVGASPSSGFLVL